MAQPTEYLERAAAGNFVGGAGEKEAAIEASRGARTGPDLASGRYVPTAQKRRRHGAGLCQLGNVRCRLHPSIHGRMSAVRSALSREYRAAAAPICEPDERDQGGQHDNPGRW